MFATVRKVTHRNTYNWNEKAPEQFVFIKFYSYQAAEATGASA
jgi:hypothetical protein